MASIASGCQYPSYEMSKLRPEPVVLTNLLPILQDSDPFFPCIGPAVIRIEYGGRDRLVHLLRISTVLDSYAGHLGCSPRAIALTY
jgi:hypothetical protein